MTFEQLFYLPSTMIWPLAACLVLTGIHVYLGVHVIARKVVFVDLALAQIAALGTVVGVLLGYEVGKDTNALYLYSLAFTIFGAFIFSATRMKGEKVPHEAIIGIVYAVTFAATILVLSKSALGPQELDHIIKGELLWVQNPTVIKTAIIYSLVGLFHFAFRKHFMAISFDPVKADQSGTNVRFWDFLFYTSFGFVITSSVAIAGVFLVFSYLVIPSVAAMLVADKLSTRLAYGWIGSSIISFIGVKLSWNTGLPTSPLIVVLFAIALIGTGIYRYLRLAPRKVIALRNLVGSFAVVALFIGGLFFFRRAEEAPLARALKMLDSNIGTDRESALIDLGSFPEQKSEWVGKVIDRLHDPEAEVRKSAIQLLTKLREPSALQEFVKLLDDPSDDVQGAAIASIDTMGNSTTAALLIQKSISVDDPELKTSLLRTALDLGDAEAIPPLISILKDGGIFAGDAFDALHSHLKADIEKGDPGRLSRWWDANKGRLRWDGSTKTFSPT
ncbi:MAG TPA: iron chelate uptake ABC transporter family permease subunit [Bacteroidota bacterium]|nr:iron chelate uptake ABC transporter family permease subunit [Bacteroidota bacterium]